MVQKDIERIFIFTNRASILTASVGENKMYWEETTLADMPWRVTPLTESSATSASLLNKPRNKVIKIVQLGPETVS